MILAFFLGCVHTPPHDPLPDPVTVRLAARHEVADDEGRDCSWEEEGLWVGERRLLGEDAPDATDWCRAPTDHWSTLDVLGQDGRFVTIQAQSDAARATCQTWDVVENRVVTLADYDEKNAPRRLKKAARLLARHPIAAPFVPDAFIVGGGHVRFCLFDARGIRHELEVP